MKSDYVTLEQLFCEYCVDAEYSEEQEVHIRDIYRNSSEENKESIRDEMIGYLYGDKLLPHEYEDFVCNFGTMGANPLDYFIWLHARGDLMCETEFKELEEWIEETEGKEALEERRKSPEWHKDVYPDNCSNLYKETI